MKKLISAFVSRLLVLFPFSVIANSQHVPFWGALAWVVYGVVAAMVFSWKPDGGEVPEPIVEGCDREAQEDLEDLERELYESYVADAGGLSWDGKACPLWDDLPKAQREHWAAAAAAARRLLV